MINAKIVLPKNAYSERLKSLRPSAALLITGLLLALPAAATAQIYTDVHNFNYADGANPLGALAQGRDGYLYGTAVDGGTVERTGPGGVVFKVAPSGIRRVLFRFTRVHGSNPFSGLTLGMDGNFSGTTRYGSVDDYGTIFRITPGGNLTTIFDFAESGIGGNSITPPIQGIDGNFYGTIAGTSVYRITPSGVFARLCSMGPSQGLLLQAADGNLYGTTVDDGSFSSGTVFKVTPEGVATIIYHFDSLHGKYPHDPLIQGNDGNFYGTTELGGTMGSGVVFQLTPRGDISVLHNFGDPNFPNDGRSPYAGLVQATDGNLYGVTNNGGTVGGAAGYGVIFKITPAGEYSILYNFDAANGMSAVSTPLQHTNGKIYGLASFGGLHGFGVLYSLDMGLGPFVSLVSTSDKVGVPLTILGQGLTGATAVFFNGTPATFKVWSDTFLKATVPSGATTGSVSVTTSTGTLTSNHEFRVHPVILTVTPASGAAGTPVVITGTSFTQTTKVTFGGGKAPAIFTVDSDTQVTATVPAGAPAGYVVLTTTGGRSRSPDTFTVTP